jgi:hypothetical protein
MHRHPEHTFAQHTLPQTRRHVVDNYIVLQSTQTCIALISDNTFFTVKGNFVFHGVNGRIPRCFFAREVNFLPGMAASVAQAAKRAFVAVSLALANFESSVCYGPGKQRKWQATAR